MLVFSCGPRGKLRRAPVQQSLGSVSMTVTVNAETWWKSDFKTTVSIMK